MGLLHTLKPEWWFAAHMHVKFTATVEHSAPPITEVANPDEIVIDEDESIPIEHNNPDEITLDEEEADVAAPLPPPPRSRQTNFLALDKCLPKRKFLEVLDIETPEPFVSESDLAFTFDPEWLAICRAFAPWFSTTKHQKSFPDEANARRLVAKEREWVTQNIGEKKEISSCQQFIRTAPGPGSEGDEKLKQRKFFNLPTNGFFSPSLAPMYPNPQTRAYCEMLGIDDRIKP